MYNLLALLLIIAAVRLLFNALRKPRPKHNTTQPAFKNLQPKPKTITELSIEDFVQKYNYKMGAVKQGSVCLYGHWFGRPYDNLHIIEEVTYDPDTSILKMSFDNNEALKLLNPLGITESGRQLIIKSADEITWEWNYEKTKDKTCLHFIKILKDGNLLRGSSSVDRKFSDLSIKKPALTIS